ncbi:MAG: hypothetical protein SV375_20975 [Thermodesulfobacteriota bacterium]|nr:hypothetical protein [Thermodesulfobacteriota bacterium]
MACPNCDDERVQWVDEAEAWCILTPTLVYNKKTKSFSSLDTGRNIAALYECPFCGEELLTASQACARGKG